MRRFASVYIGRNVTAFFLTEPNVNVEIVMYPRNATNKVHHKQTTHTHAHHYNISILKHIITVLWGRPSVINIKR